MKKVPLTFSSVDVEIFTNPSKVYYTFPFLSGNKRFKGPMGSTVGQSNVSTQVLLVTLDLCWREFSVRTENR